jgi:transposase
VQSKKLGRDQVLAFFGRLPSCTVTMEACGGAHFWRREIGMLGHGVRLSPPACVNPFVKRKKTDAADAEAICEAALRPTMRFIPVKSEETQGAANASKLIAIVEDPECGLPTVVIPTLKVRTSALTQLEAEISKLDAERARRAKENDVARRLMTVPGIGPLIATAIATLAPPPETAPKAGTIADRGGRVPSDQSPSCSA